nr:unnamed protein product [Callosobruchus chinensis]
MDTSKFLEISKKITTIYYYSSNMIKICNNLNSTCNICRKVSENWENSDSNPVGMVL